MTGMIRRLLLPITVAFVAGGLAVAQTGLPQDIALAEREAREAALRSRQLSDEAAKATGAAARANAQSGALVADIQKIEADITAASARIALAETERRKRRTRLAERQQPVVRLIAALQSMTRRPPALALVQPGSVDEIVRTRALLASTLPVVRRRSAALRADLAAADRLKAEASRNAAVLAASRDALRQKRIDLARLESSERQRSQSLAEAALFETDRSAAFDEEVRALAAEMRGARHQARIREELAALPGPLLRSTGRSSARSKRPAAYQLPVEGRLVTGMGEISDAGVHERGLTFQTAAGALVVAPRGGRIVYAGRFRSYGEVVIIDHGGGWTTTITDLAALRVKRGETVQAGAPIGRARGRLSVELRRNERPAAISPHLAPG
jgi:septal ring factor EnvC (AmiA/AmiB activator)